MGLNDSCHVFIVDDRSHVSDAYVANRDCGPHDADATSESGVKCFRLVWTTFKIVYCDLLGICLLMKKQLLMWWCC